MAKRAVYLTGVREERTWLTDAGVAFVPAKVNGPPDLDGRHIQTSLTRAEVAHLLGNTFRAIELARNPQLHIAYSRVITALELQPAELTPLVPHPQGLPIEMDDAERAAILLEGRS